MVARMPSTETSPGVVSPTAVVESFLDALRALDVERALSFCAEEIVYQNVPFPPDRGLAQVRRTLGLFGRFADHFEARMYHIAERDGFVLTERLDVIRGPVLDLELWVCGTFEVRNGKIVLWRDYFDLATAAVQVATSPVRRLIKRRRAR
jgi:limonene-1,2-epoxide hydrolase